MIKYFNILFYIYLVDFRFCKLLTILTILCPIMYQKEICNLFFSFLREVFEPKLKQFLFAHSIDYFSNKV